MPGLPNGAFPENAKMSPDSIGGCNGRIFVNREYPGFFKTGVFSLKRAGFEKRRGSKKDARQNAIGGSGGHYMGFNSGLFFKTGRF
jgi:hypothetical protein